MSDAFTVKPVPRTVVARAGGAVLAETQRALLLEEPGHEPVYYIPREDVAMEFLERSDTRTECPHKGEATHYHVIAKSGPLRDAAWSYEQPTGGADRIAHHIAFYPDKTFVEEL